MLTATFQGTGNLTFVYGSVAILSILLAVCYILWEKKKESKFLLLSGCVAIVNTGYFLLAAASSLPMAMFANGISYFGAAYSMLAMLLIIFDVCQKKSGSGSAALLWESAPPPSCWLPAVTGLAFTTAVWILSAWAV